MRLSTSTVNASGNLGKDSRRLCDRNFPSLDQVNRPGNMVPEGFDAARCGLVEGRWAVGLDVARERIRNVV